jgi:predicted DNA-binding transcriptional regulator AlpA
MCRVGPFLLCLAPAIRKQDGPQVAKTSAKKRKPQKFWLRQTSLHTPVQQQPGRVRVQGSPRLLDRVEVQAVVGLSYPTIWSWMRAGNFPAPASLAASRCGSKAKSSTG